MSDLSKFVIMLAKATGHYTVSDRIDIDDNTNEKNPGKRVTIELAHENVSFYFDAAGNLERID